MLDLYNLMKQQGLHLQQLTKDNENLSARLLAIDEKLTISQKEIQQLKQENTTLRNQVTSLQLDVNELKQEQLSNNLVISGTGALQKGLSPLQNFQKIVNVLEIDVETKDLSDIYTIRRKSGEQLVVKFVCAQGKIEVMDKMKTARREAKDSDAQFLLENVFFNDHLTPYYENLWFRCRALKKKSTLAHAWTKMGKLYLKKLEGGAAMRIHNIDDLSQVYSEYGLEI
jgi:predicted RNase H-like nuclease (RuvC/YqgF family)